jgi:hypothetical protein
VEEGEPSGVGVRDRRRDFEALIQNDLLVLQTVANLKIQKDIKPPRPLILGASKMVVDPFCLLSSNISPLKF